MRELKREGFMMERIAIASSDGIHIDLHFGIANGFYIYAIDDQGNITPEERREVTEEWSGNGKYSRLEAMARHLSDVSYVLCARIGSNAVETLRKFGITGYAVPGGVQQALDNYVKRRRFSKNISAYRITDCGGPGGCAGDDCY